jgi:hypothetical protein
VCDNREKLRDEELEFLVDGCFASMIVAVRRRVSWEG